MLNKNQIRKKYFKIRKLKYYEVSNNYFNPLTNFFNKKFKNKKINLSFYYPSNCEVNILKFFHAVKKKKNIITLLPSIVKKNDMSFYRWNFLDILKVNKYGMLEPFFTKKNIIPDILLVPLLAFDKKNNRLGYGKGYYDRYLNKYLNKNKNIMTIGIAFAFQKYNKIPSTKQDVKLNYILTENGMNKL